MVNLIDFLSNFETKSFLLFYLLSRFRFKYYTTEQIHIYQRKQIKKTLEHAIKNSKFFKHKFNNINLNNFSALPTTNKAEMMENLTDYNTIGLTKEQIIDFCLEIEKTKDFSKRLKGLNIGMSSGTSGNKGVEIVTKEEEMYMKSALFARFDFPKSEKINLAFILRVSAPAFNLNKWGHKLTYISQLSTISDIVYKLQHINPNVLSAPPSMLKLIANEIKDNRLSIKPKRIISYAEVLYPDVKIYLNEIFACPIHEIYKCTEGPIAITCKYGKLHINEDLVYVETLNLDGTKSEHGIPCQKLIVTDLHKRAQPIIRYELNDLITISKNGCDCGSKFRAIESIQGRSDDIFWAKNLVSNKWQFIIPDYISRCVISSSELIDEYQVIQNSPLDILIRIQLKKGCSKSEFESARLIDNFQKLFCEYGCDTPNVTIKFENPQVNVNSQKLIRIHRDFTLD